MNLFKLKFHFLDRIAKVFSSCEALTFFHSFLLENASYVFKRAITVTPVHRDSTLQEARRVS